MINYSLALRSNPMNKEAAKRVYAVAQYSEIMELDEFAKHISSHGCVYSRADIQATLTLAVDCIRELLLKGQRIRLGKLGTFAVSLNSKGADSPEDFNTLTHIRSVNVKFTPGKDFGEMKGDATFNRVLGREDQAKAIHDDNVSKTV